MEKKTIRAGEPGRDSSTFPTAAVPETGAGTVTPTSAVRGDAVFVVPYPFVRDTRTEYDGNEEDGPFSREVPTWRPGVRIEQSGREGEYIDSFADAMGKQILTVLSIHKPGPKYATRVFYLRRWVDPDGREFGKNELRIRGISSFTALTRGYRHRFELVGAEATSHV